MGRWQLLQNGVTAHKIKRRLRHGRLVEIHRGVYLVGHAARHPHALKTAALLACHPNAKVGRWEVDFLWRELNFGVETDGYDGHQGRAAFERDRLKANELNALASPSCR